MSTGISTWHPVNGEWVHIVQKERGNSIVYYTNGKLEGQEFVSDLAYVFKPVRKPNKTLKRRQDKDESANEL